jgi:perosamine synthetase
MKKITCARPFFDDVPAILADLERVLTSGRLMLGDYLKRFETGFAALTGVSDAVAVNSCTSALEICLRFLKLEGGEVIVPTDTFVATANAVLFAGGRPVLADVEPRYLSLTLSELQKRLTPRTKAVILVHVGGLVSPEVEAIAAFCSERGIALIEDCAHAHGATFSGRPVGSFGLAGCFSFYATKVMTTGTGGMLTTSNESLAEFARSLRLHGRGTGSRGGLDAIVNLGNDWFMDEIRCVLGVHQLSQLPQILAHRNLLADRYCDRLKKLPEVTPLVAEARCRASYYKFMIILPSGVSVQNLGAALLEKHGIETESLYWPTVHLQPLYREKFGYKEGDFPRAEDSLSRQICLPIHGKIEPEDVDSVVDGLAQELRSFGKKGA